MGTRDDDRVKRREIQFSTLHPDPRQAHTAATLLEGLEGILYLEARAPLTLWVHYHLEYTCLANLEQVLDAHGLHLDNTLLFKLKRALAHYTEQTQRENLGCPRGDTNCTTKVFISSYQRRVHGCRDERPEHWRRYL
jgi:hypothetical protein